MTYRETCPRCRHVNEGEFPGWIEPEAPVFHFACTACNHYFDVENLPKIIWKLDEFSKTWYTTLVHRYTKIDNVTTKEFDYYD